jgi:hypothetical protein
LHNLNRRAGDSTADRPGREPTKTITVDLTVEEVKALIALASDQLFRREFIDPKMPGYKRNSAEISLCKSALGRLQLVVEGPPKPTTNGRGVAQSQR